LPCGEEGGILNGEQGMLNVEVDGNPGGMVGEGLVFGWCVVSMG